MCRARWGISQKNTPRSSTQLPVRPNPNTNNKPSKPVNKPDQAHLAPPLGTRGYPWLRKVCPHSGQGQRLPEGFAQLLPEILRFTAQHFPPAFHTGASGETESVPKGAVRFPSRVPKRAILRSLGSGLRLRKRKTGLREFRTPGFAHRESTRAASPGRVFSVWPEMLKEE